MWIYLPFLVSLAVFGLVMYKNPHSLWSGTTALGLLMGTGFTTLFMVFAYSNEIMKHPWLYILLLIILMLVMAVLLFFPIGLGLLFFVEGVRLVRREGFRLANCLSIAFSLMIFFVLLLAPHILNLSNAPVFTYFYFLLALVVFFFSAELAIYTLSAAVNLIHIKKKKLSQIVVLGSGIMGRTVPPLLQSRIKRGIELQQENPEALLILSGGKGPGEDIPEGAAMKEWALKNGADPKRTISEEKSRDTEENLRFSKQLFKSSSGKTAVVSNGYHVFRALVFSKEQHLNTYGYGAKTKWYFSLNAFLREFIAYLSHTRKKQLTFLSIFLFPYLFTGLVSVLFRH